MYGTVSAYSSVDSKTRSLSALQGGYVPRHQHMDRTLLYRLANKVSHLPKCH